MVKNNKYSKIFFSINSVEYEGQGKLIMRDGSFIEGEFKNGEIVGKGYKYDKFRESEYTGKAIKILI
jgi:hypothetical protein